MKDAHHYSDWGNANQNQDEILLDSQLNSYTLKKGKQQCWQELREVETLVHAGGNMK